MKKIFKFSIIVTFLGFTSCSDIKKGLGFEKDVPNEFLIRRADPIERPPNYDLLPPDSKENVKVKKVLDTSKNTKSIIDTTLKQKSSKEPQSNKSPASSDIEENILKQIGK